MKRNYVSLIIRIMGIGIIITGFIMTAIPLFNFNVFTFNLGRAIVFAFGFTFIGIVLIIGSIVYNSYKRINSIDEIADQVKDNLVKEKESKKPKKCEYCGNKIKSGENKCNNCGASTNQE